MKKLVDIEGIGKSYAEKLIAAGVMDIEGLLEQGAAPKDRKALSEKSGITEKLILRWVNMADLFRIRGIAEQFADLLEAGGVDTVPELAQRNAENLQKHLAEVNKTKKLTRKVPSLTEVTGWVNQAKTLPRKVTY